MKGLRKFNKLNIDLFLPLAAMLLGILIMGLKTPVTIQSIMAVPMPQTFVGEYSYDALNWQPLEDSGDLSARNQDLYVRGHFNDIIYEGSRLYFFADHIGSEISVNGELMEQDIILEMEQHGVRVQPSMCSREWKFHYFGRDVMPDELVEIHIRNPHTFGNKNAYNYFFETLCSTPNEEDLMAKNLSGVAQPSNVAGIMLAMLGALMLCASVVSTFLRVPMENMVLQTGLLAVFTGGCFLMDTVDLSFRSDSHIFNTYGWQICVMYSAYLLGTMARDLLEGKRKQIAVCVMAISVAVDIMLIVISFAGAVLMYDTLGLWVNIQWVICVVLIVCCLAELISGSGKNTLELAALLMVFFCITLDSMSLMSSIYSRTTMTKAAVILLLMLKLFQFSRSIIINFKASSRAHTLEKELEESRIAIMISQIQPHFIFNVLGTIRGLCREDPEQAWYGLGDFSTYLRANMNALTNEKSIPFDMELAHVKTYLRLEQMRLGEKLNVVYDIQEKGFFIPPLMLQPLVENAVKHGLFYKTDGGTVTIRSVRKDRSILLSVEDDGVGFEVAARQPDFVQREHHGLENVRFRVEKMLGGSLRISSHPESGSTVTLEFPIDNHS